MTGPMPNDESRVSLTLVANMSVMVAAVAALPSETFGVQSVHVGTVANTVVPPRVTVNDVSVVGVDVGYLRLTVQNMARYVVPNCRPV